MTYKVCKQCGEKQPVSMYAPSGYFRKKTGEQTLRNQCRTCVNKRKSNRRRKIAAQIQAYKETLSCQICGYSKEQNKEHFCAKALQFHHAQGNKKFEVGNAGTKGFNWEGVKKEIDKCVVVCSNCHASLHHCK